MPLHVCGDKECPFMCAEIKSAPSCVITRHGLSQFFCLRPWSASGVTFVASFVFAVFE